MSELSAMFRAGLRREARQRKSDDLVEFMRSEWRLFAPSRKAMDSLCEELAQRDDLSVDALCEALKVPEYVLFRKVKVAETARTLLRFATSESYKAFNREREKARADHRAPGLCLFLVAGDHTLVLTNLRVEEVTGLLSVRMPEAVGLGVSVFPASDAPARMSWLFGREAVEERFVQ